MLIRVDLPAPLRRLASIPGHEVTLDLASATLEAVIRELEARYPALRGTILDHHTQQRRPFLRFFAMNEDISQQPLDAPLPEPIANGSEPLLIIAGIAGG